MREHAADIANGCAPVPKPPGDPRLLVLAAIRRGAGTHQEIREATKLSCGDAKRAVTWLDRGGHIRRMHGRLIDRKSVV